MNRHTTNNFDSLGGDRFEGLNPETPAGVEIKHETGHSPSVNPAKDPGEALREEKVELLMKNIREFIRGIDVKSL